MFAFLDSAPRRISQQVLNIITPARSSRIAGNTAPCPVLYNVPRRYRSRPFRGDRDYLNKAIYVTYHGQDNSCATLRRDTSGTHGAYAAPRRVALNAGTTYVHTHIPRTKKEIN